MSCEICCEKINLSTRKEILCNLCDTPKSLCMTCFGKYLLNSPSIAPKCLFCQRELSMDFIHEKTNKTFIKQYQDHIFTIKFGLEESKLPETQEVANEMKWREHKERKLKHLHNQKKIIIDSMKLVKDDLFYVKKFKEDSTPAENELKTLKQNYDNILSEIMIVHYERHNNNRKEKTQVQFIKACPSDTCRGFLSTAYKCGTCEKFFCPDCNEVKQSRNDETHICNEEAKATIALIKSDSKPCPKCAIMIFRSSGCPQMWCIKCHTAFDWNTGLIDRGYVHNPEYFRYLRERGDVIPRNPGDILNGCNNRPPQVAEIRRALNRFPSHLWFGWYDYLNHVRWYVLPNDARNARNEDYQELRIKYLNSEITRGDWKKQLKMKMKKDELRMERFFILDMYCNVVTDIFTTAMMNQDMETFTQSCIEIFNYTNQQMTKLNKKYDSVDTRLLLKKTDNRIKDYFVQA